MSNKKKKDFLENIYYLFEKSLQDHPEKKIVKNYKLVNGSGITREIDIYLEYKIGFKTFKYAVECKNHKREIPISDISDFAAKVRGTDVQGLFVSISKYQSGAIAEAQALGIKLYQLEKVQLSQSIKGVFVFKRMFKIREVSPIIIDDTITQELRDEILACNGCREALDRCAIEQYGCFNSCIDEMITEVYPNWHSIDHLSKHVGYEKGYDFCVVFEYKSSPMKHKGVSLDIKFIKTKVRIWEEVNIIDNKAPDSYKLTEYGTNNVFAIISPMAFEIEGNRIFSTITTSQELGAVAAYGNPDSIANSNVVKVSSIHISETPLAQFVKGNRRG